jgi:putative transcriptional regulator
MENLQDKFLIATPDMDDDYFDRSVIYICEHNDTGAMGLMISAPTDLSVMELLAKMDFMMAGERDYSKDQMVLSGGPMNQDRGFILHTTTPQTFIHSYPVSESFTLTTSGDILDTFGTEQSPEKFIVCLGCCTWRADQLEQEIAQNMWLVAPSDEKILFETGYLDRWSEANELLGITGILGKAGRA